MSTLHHRFLEPLDILVLRSNKLFGAAGSFGEALVPPWPSVAAGALRSRMLADDPALSATTLQDPAHFMLTAFQLARRVHGAVEVLHAMPADVVVNEDEHGAPVASLLHPRPLAQGLLSSAPLAKLPVLAERTRHKPAPGYWLNEAGWRTWINGQAPKPQHLVHATELWSLDPRVGVGLDAAIGSAEDGKLFTVQTIAFKPEIGFYVGAQAQTLPGRGALRFGGDGHAVMLQPVADPTATFPLSGQIGTFKLVLTTPGIFPQGWKLPGLDDSSTLQLPGGASARLVSAAVPRAAVVSGWDLAAKRPKPAQRSAVSGSVYWFEDFDGDVDALRKLSINGLWGLPGQNDDPQRQVEGFNRCAIGAWK